jgi:hypothetical protein
MGNRIEVLVLHEYEALLAALRRDIRNELDKAASRPEWADYHHANARISKRILEALNPKARGCTQAGTAVPDML